MQWTQPQCLRGWLRRLRAALSTARLFLRESQVMRLSDFYPAPPEGHVSRIRLEHFAEALTQVCRRLNASCPHLTYATRSWNECINDIVASVDFSISATADDPTASSILREAFAEIDERPVEEPLSLGVECFYDAREGAHFQKAADVVWRRIDELPPPTPPRKKKAGPGKSVARAAPRARALAAARVKRRS